MSTDFQEEKYVRSGHKSIIKILNVITKQFKNLADNVTVPMPAPLGWYLQPQENPKLCLQTNEFGDQAEFKVSGSFLDCFSGYSQGRQTP